MTREDLQRALQLCLRDPKHKVSQSLLEVCWQVFAGESGDLDVPLLLQCFRGRSQLKTREHSTEGIEGKRPVFGCILDCLRGGLSS